MSSPIGAFDEDEIEIFEPSASNGDFDENIEIKEEIPSGDSSDDEPLVYHVERKKIKGELTDDPFKDVDLTSVDIKEEKIDEMPVELVVKLEPSVYNDDGHFDDVEIPDDHSTAYQLIKVENEVKVEIKKEKKKKKLKKSHKKLKTKKSKRLKLKKESGGRSQLHKLWKEMKYTKCSLCSVQFNSKDEVMVHLRTEHLDVEGSLFYKCQSCNLCFRTKDSLRIHTKRAHIDSFQCRECDMIIVGKGNHIKHIKSVHRNNYEGGVACKECFMTFQNEDTLKFHMIRKHNHEDANFHYRCGTCPMTYDNSASLAMHIRRKHVQKEEIYDCSFCSEVFDDKDTYGDHMVKIHQGGDQLASVDSKCSICSLVLVSKSRLRNHMQKMHSVMIEDLKYKCEQCEMSYDKLLSLNVHIARKHNKILESKKEENPVVEVTCQFCNITFVSEHNLKLHLIKKHKIYDDTFKFECNACEMRFTSTSSLNHHVWRKHGPNSLFCDKCNRQFESTIALENHIHISQLYQCPMCEKIYQKEGMLTKHLIKEHNMEDGKETKFTCSHCSRGYQSYRKLIYHINKDHTERNCPCKICGYVLNSKEQLRRHILKDHEGSHKVTGYMCLFCYSYTSGSTEELSNHIWTTHDQEYNHENEIVKTLPCPKCDDRFLNYLSFHTHFEENHIKSEAGTMNTICQICGLIILTSNFRKHLENHTKLSTTRCSSSPKCEHCDFVGKTKMDLTFHMLRHASKEMIICDVDGCNFTTHYKSSLESHKRIKHVSREVFQCSKCVYQTTNKYLMKYHEDEHATGRKKYNCDKCDYSTQLPASFAQHKYKHVEEKPFKCEQCSFATKYSTSLRQHIVKKHSNLVV